MDLNNSSYVNETLVPRTPRLLDHTIITLYSILLVWSLLGNVLVIAVVYCNQNLKTNMNYLIVNMAVSDLLVPLIALPWRISGQIVGPGHWLVEGPLGETLCKLVFFLSNTSPYVSSISMLIITAQRFIAIVYTTRRQILTRKMRWILISLPWIVAIALLSPSFYTFRLINKQGYAICVYSWSPAFEFWRAHMTYLFILSIVGYISPLIAIIILYSIIQYKLQKSLNNVKALIEKETIRSRQWRNRRMLNMAITIIVMFTICWFPLGILNLFAATQHHSIHVEYGIMKKIAFPFSFMWYLQAAINPCIYFVFLRDFRQGLKKLCSRKNAQ